MAPQPVLEDGGGDVLAAGCDDQLLLAAGDEDESVVVDLAQIAGAEPPVLRESGGRRLGVVVVSNEDVVAFAEDLAVVVHGHIAAGVGGAHRADAHEMRSVDGGRRGRLGQPVAFVDLDADAAEEVAEARPQRRASRNAVAQTSPEDRADRGVDQALAQAVLGLERKRRPAGCVEPARVLDRDLGEVPEELELEALAGLGVRRVVDLLKNPRDG